MRKEIDLRDSWGVPNLTVIRETAGHKIADGDLDGQGFAKVSQSDG